MKSLTDKKATESIILRIQRIEPDLKPLWGNMSAHQILKHLAEPLKCGLGDVNVMMSKSTFSIFPINKIISQYIPWPKGAPTSQQFIDVTKNILPADFETNKANLIMLIERFSQYSGNWPLHPVFGKLNEKEWKRLQWRHLDHHLQQLGIN